MAPAMQALRERRCLGGWKRRRLARLTRHPELRLRRQRAAKRGREEEPSAEPEPAGPPAKRGRFLALPKSFSGGEGEGEQSRDQVGLELVGEVAPSTTKWEYPLIDEPWRCFAGYLPKALPAEQTPKFFQMVKKGTKWLQPSGKWGPLPLRTAWMTDEDCKCKYGYGGAIVLPEPYTDWMKEILAACMPLCGISDPKDWPNSCNLNLYVDGNHSVGWHADNEKLFQGMVKDCRIISLSLGQTRKFELQCRGGPLFEMDLNDGDLCTMEGLTQKYYRHRVGKQGGRDIKERINLTWRWVVEHADPCTKVAAAAA